VQAFRRAVHEAQESKHNEPHRLRIGVSSFHPLHVIEMLRSVELRLYRNLSVSILGSSPNNTSWPIGSKPSTIIACRRSPPAKCPMEIMREWPVFDSSVYG
jgi:hypothetical protein